MSARAGVKLLQMFFLRSVLFLFACLYIHVIVIPEFHRINQFSNNSIMTVYLQERKMFRKLLHALVI